MSEKIKILCVEKLNSPSHYLRLNYPLSKINGKNLENREIEVVFQEYNEKTLAEAEKFDIFIYHWDIGASYKQLQNLQDKGVKIIYSLDDAFWGYSELHPYYNTQSAMKYIFSIVTNHLLGANAVIVPTERLAINCMKYADNIAILPNFLDKNDYKIEKTYYDKLKVGIFGSQSHYGDWKSIKGAINRIAKNKQLSEKCEFWVCGAVKGDKYWDDIIKLFKIKKNLNVVIKEVVPVTECINLLSELDVCLIPLEITEFNLSKSALRLMECAIAKVVPVGSGLYSGKELKGIVVCDTPISYEQTLLKLLDKDYYTKVLNYITEINLKDADFEKRIENTIATIGAVYMNDLPPRKIPRENTKIEEVLKKEEINE